MPFILHAPLPFCSYVLHVQQQKRPLRDTQVPNVFDVLDQLRPKLMVGQSQALTARAEEVLQPHREAAADVANVLKHSMGEYMATAIALCIEWGCQAGWLAGWLAGWSFADLVTAHHHGIYSLPLLALVSQARSPRLRSCWTS